LTGWLAQPHDRSGRPAANVINLFRIRIGHLTVKRILTGLEREYARSAPTALVALLLVKESFLCSG
jgi:hypothetical protein